MAWCLLAVHVAYSMSKIQLSDALAVLGQVPLATAVRATCGALLHRYLCRPRAVQTRTQIIVAPGHSHSFIIFSTLILIPTLHLSYLTARENRAERDRELMTYAHGAPRHKSNH